MKIMKAERIRREETYIAAPPSFVEQIHVDWHRYSLNTDLLNFLSSLECPNVYSKSWNFENIKSFAL